MDPFSQDARKCSWPRKSSLHKLPGKPMKCSTAGRVWNMLQNAAHLTTGCCKLNLSILQSPQVQDPMLSGSYTICMLCLQHIYLCFAMHSSKIDDIRCDIICFFSTAIGQGRPSAISSGRSAKLRIEVTATGVKLD